MSKTVMVSTKCENPDAENNVYSASVNSNIVVRLMGSLGKNIAILFICAFTVVIALLTVAIVVILKRQSLVVNVNILSNDKNLEPENQTGNGRLILSTPISEDEKLTTPSTLRIISRQEWLAQPRVRPVNPLPIPVPYVIIHHTATENCFDQAKCKACVRSIQSFHLETRNFSDIAYNFLVAGDGAAYEGRGWKFEGAHTLKYNNKSIGIAFIGNFNKVKPPQEEMKACKELVAKGVELGYIRQNYKLFAARQLRATESPGMELYEELQTWDHWASTP